MTLTEGFIRDSVFIDFGTEILYGSDQVYITYPERFPTVGFQLYATEGLTRIADRIRKEIGFVPTHPLDEYDAGACESSAWYDFFVGVNGFSRTHIDSAISFVVAHSESLDNESMYSIDLTEEEQNVIFACLDAQCRKYLGKGCEDLLEEARTRMEDNST